MSDILKEAEYDEYERDLLKLKQYNKWAVQERKCEHCFCQTEMVGGELGTSYSKPGKEHEKCCMCGTRRLKSKF